MKRYSIGIAAAVLSLAVWLYFWCQPERQVRRAQARLVDALESGDFDAFAALLADDYRDAWGHDKTFVQAKAREVFSQFVTLDIVREERGFEPGGPIWVLREKMSMVGMGGALAMAVRERTNQLREPFTMTWRKQSWKPWDWQLTHVAQPEISEEELDVRF